MATSKTPILPTYVPVEQKQQDQQLPCSALKWRQKQLLVSLEQKIRQPHLPPLENKQWLVECLKHSPVKLIRVDAALGKASLKFWADACEQANKAVFLRLPNSQLPKQKNSLSRWLKRSLDWCGAALLLLVASPILLGLFCLMRMQSSEPIFLQQWCVGERGKLFRRFRFRTTVATVQALEDELIGEPISLQKSQADSQITPLESWMCKYSLDKLPQLFNVLQGNMSLLGPRPLTLDDVVQLRSEEVQQIKALPEITRV